MHRALPTLALSACLASGSALAADWQVQRIDTPARVTAIDTVDGGVRVNAGGLWYRVVADEGGVRLEFVDRARAPEQPDGALPDGLVVSGTRDIARVWLAEPVTRYDHGVLGDKIEAGSLVIEPRDGKRQIVRLKDDAVFEDLRPRLADLDGDGHDEIVVVKSYLKRGSALAVIGARDGKYDVIAETPPLGAPHRWLDPVGAADFNGDGKIDLALVRQPHVVGSLELWNFADKKLRLAGEMADTANHIAGTRAINMHAVADFDGDGVADIALPSLDRSRIRMIAFAPQPREIASVTLPGAKAATDLGLVAGKTSPLIAVGLADGTLAVIRRNE